jgi:fluoride exporter
MRLLTTYLAIFLGSALGGLARYGCGALAVSLWGDLFPWGTLIVNIVGSYVIAGFATLTAPESRLYVPPLGRQFVMVGLCGGYTTFSAFSLESLSLLRAGRVPAALAYVALSIALCLAAAWLAHEQAARLSTRRRA